MCVCGSHDSSATRELPAWRPSALYVTHTPVRGNRPDQQPANRLSRLPPRYGIIAAAEGTSCGEGRGEQHHTRAARTWGGSCHPTPAGGAVGAEAGCTHRGPAWCGRLPQRSTTTTRTHTQSQKGGKGIKAGSGWKCSAGRAPPRTEGLAAPGRATKRAKHGGGGRKSACGAGTKRQKATGVGWGGGWVAPMHGSGGVRAPRVGARGLGRWVSLDSMHCLLYKEASGHIRGGGVWLRGGEGEDTFWGGGGWQPAAAPMAGRRRCRSSCCAVQCSASSPEALPAAQKA